MRCATFGVLVFCPFVAVAVFTDAFVQPAAPAQPSAAQPLGPQDVEASRPYPVLVTPQTSADAAALAALEKPGTVIFSDGFESVDSFKSYFETLGLEEGRAKITADPAIVHTGKGALQLTAIANEGKSSGAGPHYWLGPEGYDRVHLRYYIKFAGDYDQGNLNHTGGGLSGVGGTNKWGGMGSAGKRPKGDEYFSGAFETWRDWGRVAAPGYMFCYTYWMDMKIGSDGNYWGNMLGPEEEERFTPQRDRWYCMEMMIKVNTVVEGVGRADGEMAAWIDGKLYLHYTGFRWRSGAKSGGGVARGTEELRIKRAGLSVYVHQARQDNTVWFDDLVISTGYIGPVDAAAPERKAPTPTK